MIHEINIPGGILKTKHYANLSDSECDEIREKLLRKPDYLDVQKELFSFLDGNSNNLKLVNRFFFYDLRANTLVHKQRWTVMEAIESNDLIRYFVGRIQNNPKTFEGLSLIDSIETVFRIGGAGVTKLPGNFNVKSCDYILDNYNINNHYYDPCCGWGTRMLCSIRKGINYYGTDPNPYLIERLWMLNHVILSNGRLHSQVKLWEQGSEEKIDTLDNKVGLVFTSPPYYDLEDYGFGKQSIYNEDSIRSYDDWKQNYLYQTLKNSLDYLINGGIIGINIKNFDKYPIMDDVKLFLNNSGALIQLDSVDYKYAGRKVPGGETQNKEEIVIFKKRE